MSGARNISITVNGGRVEHAVESRMHLADFLRKELGLTGTHIGCEHGMCGACTVLVDGASARTIDEDGAIDGNDFALCRVNRFRHRAERCHLRVGDSFRDVTAMPGDVAKIRVPEIFSGSMCVRE